MSAATKPLAGEPISLEIRAFTEEADWRVELSDLAVATGEALERPASPSPSPPA